MIVTNVGMWLEVDVTIVVAVVAMVVFDNCYLAVCMYYWHLYCHIKNNSHAFFSFLVVQLALGTVLFMTFGCSLNPKP